MSAQVNAENWKEIPGFDGMYQISREGDVRTWRWRGERRMNSPKPMRQYMKHNGKRGKSRFVKLTDATGTAKEYKVLRLMADIWLGGVPEGKVPYHKNGDLADHCINNIGFTTRYLLGKKTGANGKRKPVKKINSAGDTVAVYTSARAAAKANYMSYQTVLDRCHGKVKKALALDGHTYAFDI